MEKSPTPCTCTECGRTCPRLRKDRCDACYMRLYRGGVVPEGAACCGCGERRQKVLTIVAVAGADAVVCGNCALILARTRPRIASLEELSARSSRERRETDDRRFRPASRLGRSEERRFDARRLTERPLHVPTLDPSID